MPIDNYLLPGEKILFWSDFSITYNEEKYRVYITNIRLLLYNETGLLLKKEEIITETFQQITALQFVEEGRVNKRGTLKFASNKGQVQLIGPANGMRSLFKAIQKQTINPNPYSALNDSE